MTPVVRNLHPIVSTTDLVATVAFLVERAGFSGLWTVDDPDGGAPVYAGLSIGGFEMHLQPIGREIEGMQAYFEIEGVDAFRDALVAGGADPGEARDQFYGMRDFELHAPGGVLLGFASRLADPATS